ncbi:MAG: DUF6164 family protein [Gammaproteobacteria bacterium]|nr:DUF6164 family protein [Gammaproteobacteria bacterium]
MPTLLIKLNSAPVDEVAEIYDLLESNHIDFYETDSGRWGISVAGFWLRDESQLELAQGLLSDYEQQRSERVQEEYNELRDSFIKRLFRQPLMIFFYLLAILAIFYITLIPFLGLLN